LVAKLDLYKDQTLRKELSSLEQHQLEDPISIGKELESDPSKFQEKYMIRDQVLHCNDKRTYPYWIVMLPRSLEYQVIKYVQIVHWAISFMPWRHKLNFTLLKEFNIEYILIVRSELEVDKKHWKWYLGPILSDIPTLCPMFSISDLMSSGFIIEFCILLRVILNYK
jgi:hypothetical protein